MAGDLSSRPGGGGGGGPPGEAGGGKMRGCVCREVCQGLPLKSETGGGGTLARAECWSLRVVVVPE